MASTAELCQLLKALSSGQNQERQQAEKMFQQAKEGAPEPLISGLMGVLGDDAAEEGLRRQAAVLARQCCNNNGSDRDFVFAKLQPATKQEFASTLLQKFETMQSPKMKEKVGDIIVKLAEASNDNENQKGWLAPGQKGWPTLLPTIFRLASSGQAINLEASLRLLKEIIGNVESYQKDIGAAQAELGAVVQAALGHQEIKIRASAFLLVCEMVGVLEKKSWAPLTATAPVLTQILQQLCQAKMDDEVAQCMQTYLEVAQVEPNFFKAQLQQSLEPAKTLAQLVKTRNGVDAGLRGLAIEWLTVYCEKKPKWLVKELPALGGLALECTMDLMLEVEDGEEALKQWASLMDDEEGEEDMDELYHNGEECIDRIVDNMKMESVSTHLFSLVKNFSSQPQWQAKLAALTAVKQTVEYVEEQGHVDELASLLLAHLDHQHPRVRYTAFHALGQMANDQAPHFQDASHKAVMPKLLQGFDDPVDRVASMAMSAFVSFGEELDAALMLDYANVFMEKLVGRLQSSKHRMVLQECITSIAVIAGVIGKEFSVYYGVMMPLLKQLVMTAKGEREGCLRGKAFECLSLLGLAVGKEKFLPDSKDAIEQMLQTDLSIGDNELLRDYIKEASERICRCLKEDFAAFLPHLMPNIFKSLILNAEEAGAAVPGKEDEFIEFENSTGKLMKVRSSKFEEVVQNVQLIVTFCEEMGGSYFDFVQSTAQQLIPLMVSSDEAMLLCNEIRASAYKAWAGLIKCAVAGATARNLPPTIANELVMTFLQRVVPIMTKDDDAESIRDAADGLSECLKGAAVGCLQPQQVGELSNTLFALIDASFARQAEQEKDQQADKASAPAELQGDEDDEDEEVEEDEARRCLEDAIGSLMRVSPEGFAAQQLNECGKRLTAWLNSKPHRVLALFLGCDLIDKLKEGSKPVWPVLMPAVFAGLHDADPDVRIPSGYAVSLAAPLPSFGEAAPEAFRKLGPILSAPAPKKKDVQAKIALDNCTSAMFLLARHQVAQCPADVNAWQLVVNKLPIRDDEEEAKKVHYGVVELLAQQHPGLIGPDNCNLGKVLSALAEVHKQENLSTEEIDTGIAKLFRMLPREAVGALAVAFSEKQQKKIEKILNAAA